jgi:hypothetical protein
MLESLPCLNGSMTNGRKGIINLIEAGNWQVHDDRKPIGLKGAEKKKVHAHVYGRSPLEPCVAKEEKMLHWGWGEAPRFPDFVNTPFSPPKPDKDWIVPEQFNEQECGLLEVKITRLFQQYQQVCP